ncbi:hypothetical protein SAMN05421640_1513 [Ekhidna lutea]|uniref:ABM domain-containing protein n=1 Tax=Ekhidna lutea TaxID=447679 RepID=A0A239HV56_EKHLU|nr:hypothetical protein [Ekhidna lutea]SNS85008.1 hypothetical protein SAMN05421640_1513 [Ekhidna lutea]
MGRIVITCYRPKPSKEEKLLQLSLSHYDRLNEQGLVTDRAPILMKAKDGSVIEVFEWKSKTAIEEAHSNEEVQKMWAEYDEACDFEKPVNIKEFQEVFSEFEPINKP